jgi:hypothetical protein
MYDSYMSYDCWCAGVFSLQWLVGDMDSCKIFVNLFEDNWLLKLSILYPPYMI